MDNNTGSSGQDNNLNVINIGGDQPAANQDLPGGGASSSGFWSAGSPTADAPSAPNQDLPGGGAPSSGFWSAGSPTADASSADSGATADATPVDEPFVGSGGVGSADYLETLRRGHEQAGQDYASDLGSSEGTASS